MGWSVLGAQEKDGDASSMGTRAHLFTLMAFASATALGVACGGGGSSSTGTGGGSTASSTTSSSGSTSGGGSSSSSTSASSGSSTSSASSSSGMMCAGGAKSCSKPSDCPAPNSPCQQATCDMGCCGAPTDLPMGAKCNLGGNVCDGKGTCIQCIQANDCPQVACIAIQCQANMCTGQAEPKGFPCNANGGVVCDGSGNCVSSHCMDGVKDADETDTDCGGATCGACGDGLACAKPSDCLSGICTGGVCVKPTCTDGIKNGSETGVDCGGAKCKGCDVGGGCINGGDCLSLVCDPMTKTCAMATCMDGVKNGNETQTDCGGGTCPGCPNGGMCFQGIDCVSQVCDQLTLTCAVPTCMDLTKNGNETGIDCGGGTCGACIVGQGCKQASDCLSGNCTAGVCVAATGKTVGDPGLSCKSILASYPAFTSGVYYIDPDGFGPDAPFQVYCDMTTDGGGWESVFKTSKGANVFDNLALWDSAAPQNAAAADCSNITTFGATSFCVTSLVTKYWNAHGYSFTSARVHAFTGGNIVVKMRFDNVTSDIHAWFSQANLVTGSSNWIDLKTYNGPNYFSVAGDMNRHFFINQSYGGCPSDAGWFIVSDSTKGCSWESKWSAGKDTHIMYSTANVYQNWNNATISEADVMMVLVR